MNISLEAGSIVQNWSDRWFGYCMSKAALNMMEAIVHVQLRERGGRVMQAHPGYIRSYMLGSRNEAGTFEPDEAAALLLAEVERRLEVEATERPEFFDLHGATLPW